MNKKGFTLVELLAVIAILSVLVLITSTAVTKMLSDSKTKLSNTQIALIKSAAETWGADNIIDLPDVGKCSYITLGELKDYGLLNDNVIDPKTGNKISDDLKIKITTTRGKSGNPIITYEVNPDNVDGCKSVIKPMCELVSGTPKTYGAAYNCEVKKGVAYKFYVLSRNDSEGDLIPESSPEVSATSYNLILSANITPDGIPITSTSLAPADTNVAWNSSGSVSEGPLTAMEYLNTATSNWVVPSLNETYNDQLYTINLTGKARLPYANELSYIKIGTKFLYDNLLWKDYGVACAEASQEFFGEEYNCINSDNVLGYWTMTTGNFYNSPSNLNSIGMVEEHSTQSPFGIRPVITLPASELE